MNAELHGYVEEVIKRYPLLESCREDIVQAYGILEDTYLGDGKLLVAGNGGSAADSEHIAGELMKRFNMPRPIDRDLAERLTEVDRERGGALAKNLEKSLMAIPLVAHEALSTAYINDVDGYGVFAQQLLGFGRKGDTFLAITTSGNSENILNAAVLAKAVGIKIIALTGEDGGKIREYADVTVRVPEKETYKVQELHLPVYHTWCMMLEERFFGKQFQDKTFDDF